MSCELTYTSQYLIVNWKQNSTLAHYTQYKPSELSDCVKALHRLCSVGSGTNLPAIREKYSQHKVIGPGPKFLQLTALLIVLMGSSPFPSSVQICCKEAVSTTNPYWILSGCDMLD